VAIKNFDDIFRITNHFYSIDTYFFKLMSSRKSSSNYSLPHHKTKKSPRILMTEARHSSECWVFSLSIAKSPPPGEIRTPTPSQHNGQRSQSGSPSYQPAPDFWPMVQGVRLWAEFGAASE